ncbi:hypothetical protein TRFO_34906 [Tritrichomonas foetus]|uniref:UBA domain-containing protein n=1 Tax=Tritrichomonas foetus TaxID=1144522 RepID=A0A1J4JM59_9EUKA|nr:hypothetical protein TRFO_34906 [Tritrichomonas foetus]|eukprot:OHS98651.1 hypothetical protein TRFO_34906 [Tritrichomonas foetus]
MPQPFPLPQLTNPIEIGEQDEEAINCLQQVGFNDREELLSLLSSDSPNMAKVFFFMLTQRQNIDSIPWGNTNNSSSNSAPNDSHNDSPNDSSSLTNSLSGPLSGSLSNSLSPTLSGSLSGSLSNSLSPTGNGGGGNIGLYDHAFGDFNSSERLDFLNPMPSASASLCESFENAQAWLGGTFPPSNLEEQVIQHINTNAVEMMCILQRFLRARNFEFFHPDYEQLVARNTQINLAITLLGEYENESQMELTIQFISGASDVFASIVKQINSLFRKMIDMDAGLFDVPEEIPFYSPLSGL